MRPRLNEVQPTARRVLYLLHSGVFLYESSDGNFNYNDFFHDGGENGVMKKRIRLWPDPLSGWWRGQDSNLRPLGYEPNELPLLHPAICFRVQR